MLATLCLRYPCNHGESYEWNLCIFLVCGVLTLIPRQRCCVVVRVLSVLGVLAVLGVGYYRNMALDYETWIQRGMPAWDEFRAK